MDFYSLGLDENLIEVLRNLGIRKPTPIQEKAIGEILDGRDFLGEAQTGTGKTLAFLLPLFTMIDESKDYIQGLILAPTRELAIQITDMAKELRPYKELNILSVYGGQDIERQIRKLKGNVHMLVATPGRLLDHLRRGSIDLSGIDYLVLDEADEMITKGFGQDIESLMMALSKDHQTLLFSATLPASVKGISKRFMKSPVRVEVKASETVLDNIDQRIEFVDFKDKERALIDLLREENPFMAIIFCNTRDQVSKLVKSLYRNGFKPLELQGDISQNKRERIMRDFRSGDYQLLVATDLAARGLDVEGIDYVINYDVPFNSESYIHRIGRTGRIGREGKAISLVSERERDNMDKIQRRIRKDIARRK